MAFLYMAGQLCEALLDWSGVTTEAALLLMVAMSGIYVLVLFPARHLT